MPIGLPLRSSTRVCCVGLVVADASSGWAAWGRCRSRGTGRSARTAPAPPRPAAPPSTSLATRKMRSRWSPPPPPPPGASAGPACLPAAPARIGVIHVDSDQVVVPVGPRAVAHPGSVTGRRAAFNKATSVASAGDHPAPAHTCRLTMRHNVANLPVPTEDQALPGRGRADAGARDTFRERQRASSRRSRTGCRRRCSGMGCFWGAERKFWQMPGRLQHRGRLRRWLARPTPPTARCAAA